MHTLLTLEWAKAGPGGEGEGHIWSSARVPGPLQQLWQHLPQWGQVCGEAQWILLRLHQFTIWRTLLQKRYNRISVFPTGVFYCLQIVVTSQETRALRESSNIHLLSLNFPLCRLSGLLLNIITYTHPHVCGGEGNGNPLQCSCLENPWTEGPCWATVHGVAQSRTRLKWLSMHAYIGERNGNPLQCSGLENPRGGGAWWAAVYGVDWSNVAAAAGVWIRAVQLSRVDSNRKARLMWPKASWALGEAGCHFCCANFPNCDFFIHKYDQIIIESSPGKPLETLKPS